jgi:hypothetical protein
MAGAFLRTSAILVIPVLVLLTGFDCTTTNQPTTPSSLVPPSYPSTAAAGESDTVWWDAVQGATSYKLYYTTDGSDPTSSSPSISVGSATVWIHTGLDPTLTYTYAVQAIGGGRVSDLSESSYGVQPLPMIHATITYDNYANADVGFMYFLIGIDANNNYVPTAGTRRTVTGYTDGYGSATFNVTVDHDNLWGYSTFEDMDGNGQLSTGDVVWGNVTATGHYGYFYWTSQLTSSKTFSKSFEAAFDSLPHVY